jgi:DNA-binding transcriptional LysR family regulator
MRYNLKDIDAFLRVAEIGSISQAAARSNTAKSILSKRISDLEHALGAKLIHRSTRGVKLTDKGIIFYERARASVHQLDEAFDELTDNGCSLSGSLRITAPVTFGTRYLGPILYRFLQVHPNVSAVVDLDDRFVDICKDGYDFAVRIGRVIGSSTVIAKPLAPSPSLVCCSPDYANRAGLPQDLESLRDHDGIGYASVPSGDLWEFLTKGINCKPCSIPLRCRLVVNSGEATRDATIAGLGLAVLPHFIAAHALKSGELIDALPFYKPTPRHIYAMYPSTRHPLRTVGAIISHLTEALRNPSWEHAG